MNVGAPSTLLLPVSERIAAVMFALCQTLTMRVRGATATVTQAQLTYIVGRLLGIKRRFRRLVERIRAGKPPRELKPRAKKPARDPDADLGFRPPPRGWRRWAQTPDKPVPPWRSPRQTFAWLLPLAPQVPGFRESAAFHRGELLGLLVEPEVQALLLASRRVGDSLRPLCWMLGIDSCMLYPARPMASAAGVLAPDPRQGTPAPSGPPPRNGSDIPEVATPGPLIVGVFEPPEARPGMLEGGKIFRTA